MDSLFDKIFENITFAVLFAALFVWTLKESAKREERLIKINETFAVQLQKLQESVLELVTLIRAK